MTELLNIKETAYMLGMTSGEVKRLVKERSIPFVDLPNGVRFCPDDLTIWINKNKGGDMTTATLTEREQKQEHMRKKPEYLEQRRQAVEILDTIQAKVDAGELTERALERPRQQLDYVLGIIGKINNQFRSDLVNSCPCEDLRDEWEEFNEQGKVVNRELRHTKQTLEREKENLLHKEKEVNRLTNPGGDGTPADEFQTFKYDKQYQDRIDTAKRQYKKIKKEIGRLETRIVELNEQIEAIQAEKARVREEMIYY